MTAEGWTCLNQLQSPRAMRRPFFDLAKDGKKLKVLEGDVNALDAVITDSADFNALINSPIYTRDEQGAAITAIAGKMKLSSIVTNTLGLMAAKRRLFVLPEFGDSAA